MNFRLKTSKNTADFLKQLQSSTNLTPNVLSRIGVALSLKDPTLIEDSQVADNSGLEFNRNTLTGEYDYIYKALVSQHAKKEISDNEYFPGLLNAHMERGIRLLFNEYKHAGNIEKLTINLIKDVS